MIMMVTCTLIHAEHITRPDSVTVICHHCGTTTNTGRNCIAVHRWFMRERKRERERERERERAIAIQTWFHIDGVSS